MTELHPHRQQKYFAAAGIRPERGLARRRGEKNEGRWGRAQIAPARFAHGSSAAQSLGGRKSVSSRSSGLPGSARQS